MASFWGGGNNLTTDSSISKQRQIAAALMNQGMDASPVGHWTQALARALQGGLGGYQMSQADAADAKLTRQRELEAATEKAKAAAKAQYDFDKFGNLWNMNYQGTGTPRMVQKAQEQAAEIKKLNDNMLYRQGADGAIEWLTPPEGTANGPKPRDYTLGAPSGTKWKDPADVNQGVEPIPGYQKPVPSELAGKLAMMKIARKGIKDTRQALESDWGPGEFGQNLAASALPDWLGGDISMLSGKIGIAKRNVMLGTESALRVMTGAAAPDSEVARYAQMFTPGVGDSKESAKQKLDALDDFMDLADKVSTAGRSGNFSIEDIDAYMAAKQAERGTGVEGSTGGGGAGRAGGRMMPQPTAPAVGEVRDGWRFKGGDPADRNSWEPAQ